MLKRRRPFGILALALALVGTTVPAAAELNSSDLNTTRLVSEGDWLRIKLEVLGLRLSYPAYRVGLELSEDHQLVFTFWVGVAMGKHLEEVGRGESERILDYHARGIARQVEELIRRDFPELWPGYSPVEDFAGVFMAPGDEWDSVPVELARWSQERLYWGP